MNKCTVELRYPARNQQAITQRLHRTKFFHSVDLRKGYHQMKLDEFTQRLLAVATPDGLYLPLTAPFGVHSLPAAFQQRISRKVLRGLEGNGVESFIDDLNVHGKTFEESIHILQQVFERLKLFKLRINGAKTILGGQMCTFLGHTITPEGHRHAYRLKSGRSPEHDPTA